MDRRSGKSEDQSPAGEPNATSAPIEALVVQRDSLIGLIKSGLGELHDHLRETGAASGAGQELRNIKYWEEVLRWVKACEGSDVLLVERRGSRR